MNRLRARFAGLPRDARRVIITLAVLLVLWIARALTEEAKRAGAEQTQSKEDAAIARDSARVCTDSAIAAQQASPPVYDAGSPVPRLTACGYYRRYQPGR